MKNKTLIASLTFNAFLVATTAFSIATHASNENVIENENIKITYVNNSKGDYNILINAKSNTNMRLSESIEKGDNKNSLSIHGLSVDKYRYEWKSDLEPAGINFQWETNK